MKQRLLAIDVLRGMTIAFMILVNNPGSWSHVYAPLLHAKWHGCTPTDLVFPFFIFTIGLSMAFSLGKNSSKSSSFLLAKALKRAGLIVLVGFLLNWFPFYDRSPFEVRVFGVLQRIGMAYAVGATLVILIKNELVLAGTSAGSLLLYWALQTYLGDYSLPDNVNRAADLAILPESVLYSGFGIPFDPEGWLGALSAGAHIIIGYLIGRRLYRVVKTESGFSFDRLRGFLPGLLLIGIMLTALGWLWSSAGYPINKPIWTGSYVLYTAGLATILLSALLYVLDVLKARSWAFPFRVFGLNPLAAFVLSGLIAKTLYRIEIDGSSVTSLLYKSGLQPIFGDKPASLIQALLMVGLIYLIAWGLYSRRIIVKL
ncbi:MAG: heparan-alpha-glucosaminide N-acetyltransferase domain-containing protein [Bacteroidota bacterium]